MGNRFCKADIEYHEGCDYWGRQYAAVNVKVHGSIEDGWRTIKSPDWGEDLDPGFTPEWVEANVSEDTLQSFWESACEVQLEAAETDIEHFFGKLLPVGNVKPSLVGRSGGWLVLEKADFTADAVESWQAPMVAAWGRFARACRAYADEVPAQCLSLLHLNVYQADQERKHEAWWRSHTDLMMA